jgi:hypothetical protein
MKKILVGLALAMFSLMLYEVKAGPPPGGEVRMIPFRTYCHPDETLMVAAVMKSFGQHISMTSDVAGGAMTLYIFENPDDGTMSIMATSRESPPLESCLIFSGSNVKHFIRPTMMPPRDTKDREA